MDGIVIRPYAPADLDAIGAVHDAARRVELRLAELEKAFLPLSVAAQREGLFDYMIDVALYEGRVAGFAAYTSRELAWLYVLPALHRRGIGEALVRHAIARVPSLCEAEVLRGNLPARRLYEKCGFSLTETVSGVMPGNEDFPVTVWRMARG